jgi:hypothetical protein
MPLFEKSKTDKKSELTEAEAVFCIFMSIIFADGKMTDEEKNEFSFFFNKIKIFKNLSITNLFPKFQTLFKNVAYNPHNVIETVSPLISSSNRLPVFTYCCDFMFADNSHTQCEENLLLKIMECLTLDEKLAENVILIARRKNQL